MPWRHRFILVGPLVLLACAVSTLQETAKAKPSAKNGKQRGRARQARLPGPDLETWLEQHTERLNARLPQKERADSGKEALALHFRTDILEGPARKLEILGTARRGARLPVKKRVYGKGCRGRWYQVQGDGYVCTTRGARVGKEPKTDLYFSLPDLTELLPHRYGKVVREEAERLYRVPTPEEDGQIAKARAGKKKWPEVVEKQMKGIYFVAIDHEEKSGKRAFYCTVRGRFVRKEDVELRSTPPMYGERLDGRRRLPLAFVYDEERPLYRLVKNRLRQVGVADKHARFRPRRRVKRRGRTLLRTEQGFLVDHAHVRLARRTKRPDGVSSEEKWIHVDLSQQTLVAYEGNTPVFATVVSSGKKGHEPPIGLFRIHKKFISVTMNGPDPTDGWYEVEEVPWTMYYWESYALHGTYWHDDFGKSRSHGCTNLAPADAKWLFYWTDPDLPYGWHSIEKKGTRVYFTK